MASPDLSARSGCWLLVRLFLMFPTTHRSLVAALANGAPEERARAFETLLAVYWKPVYKYLRVRWTRTREEAEDLTQGFFARAFEKESLASYDAGKASFRGLFFARFSTAMPRTSARRRCARSEAAA